MNDEEFRQALGHLQDRVRRHLGNQVSFQQGQTETRLRAAGVGERTLDARNLAGKIGVQGGVTMVSKSGTPAVGNDAGSRATTFQQGRVKDIRVQTDVAPVGGALGVRVLMDGAEVGTVTIPDGGTRGYLTVGDVVVPAGAWFTFDFTSVGATTPGGRTYVAVGLDVEARRGGMAP